ncbi:ParB/RepB/Spo0J family partition protein [Massiliimalia massiliensis]|jgi:ParB family chromosome partitioning protein|uniref:ParB/RepB/Spo0J family partition protein n=1 Tax=Massiliimalia massiliensis TaxID=1852384 RepID=UPI000986C7BD|nr:ParB/RepB/Spo0J family partition protein [Massiliimalia massiliensis]
MQLTLKKDKVVNRVVLLDIGEIQVNPAQPRTVFDERQLQALADSIRQNGLLQPITVRRSYKGCYELISGERRLRACRMIGKQKIESIVLDKSERESAILSMIENLHREDLNFFEQAAALKNLIHEWNVTQEEAAVKLGIAQSTIANRLRILKLTPQEQDLMIHCHLTERHARALLKVDNPQKRLEIIKYIAENELNVAQTEKYIEKSLEEKHQKKCVPIIKDVRLFINTINKAISVMKSAGIPATAKKVDDDAYIEYVIKIPKGKRI